MEEWQAALKLPGGEGGMRCVTFDWETHCKEYTEDVEKENRRPTITDDLGARVWQDNQAITKQLRKMGKRRAFPD